MHDDSELSPECTAIIDESIRLELQVGDLYHLFCSIFPQDRPFWWRIAEEEKDHAALIRSGKEYFAPLKKFPLDMLHSNIGDLKATNVKIRAIIDKYRIHPPSRAEAMQVAHTIENSAGELHFQRFMDGTGGSAIERIFRDLNRGDEAHAQRIREYMQQCGIEMEPPVS